MTLPVGGLIVGKNPCAYAGMVNAVLRALRRPWYFLLLLGIPLAGFAGYKPGAGWPELSTPFFRATTPVQAGERVAHWKRQPGFVVSGYRDTGSMRPFLQGGRELLVMESCRPQTLLAAGQLVQFNRGDTAAVLHYIAAISRDGSHVYMSGVNCRQSDGWVSRNRVMFVVREIITASDAFVTPAPLLTAQPAGRNVTLIASSPAAR